MFSWNLNKEQDDGNNNLTLNSHFEKQCNDNKKNNKKK